MTTKPLLALVALSLTACTRNESRAPQSAPPTAPPSAPSQRTQSAPTPPPVDLTDRPSTHPYAQAGSLADGFFASETAIARIAHSARWMLVQRRDGMLVAERFEELRCAIDLSGNREGPVTNCNYRSERCTGELHVLRRNVTGGGGSMLTITAQPREPQHAARCQLLAAVIDGRFAGPIPPPLPNISNAQCLSAEMTYSPSLAACASVSADSVQTYTGPCCLGQPVARFSVRAQKRWLSEDARTLVLIRRSETVTVEEQMQNAVVLTVHRGEAQRELRVQDLFAGDPALATRTGFSFDTRIDGDSLVVSVIGGAPHRLPLMP